MTFASVSFLYCFLPALLLIYYIAPKKLRNAVLLVASLFFCFVGEQALAVVSVFSAAVNYACALLIQRRYKRRFIRRAVFIAGITVNLGLLGYFGYFGFFAESISIVTGLAMDFAKIALPLGISFYTLRNVGYITDVYRGRTSAERNFIDFAAYVTLFPLIIAGPVVGYGEMKAQLKERTHSLSDFSYGIRRFVFGLSKKMLLADALAELVKTIGYSDEKTVLIYWLSAVAFTLRIYFDFSGYSDMAIGLGRMFGFRFCENFDYPFISAGIGEFYRRWHISLGKWFDNYICIPLGVKRAKGIRLTLIVLIVAFLMGLWHGASWNFILWGLLFGVLFLCEKAFWEKLFSKIPKAFGVIFTMFFVVIGFVLFSADDVNSAAQSVKSMFGLSALPLSGTLSLYYLRSYAVVSVISIIAATPLIPKLLTRVNKKILNAAEPVVCCALLVLCTGYIIDGSVVPFVF